MLLVSPELLRLAIAAYRSGDIEKAFRCYADLERRVPRDESMAAMVRILRRRTGARP